MNHPEWLGDFTKEELMEMLNNNSKIWIYYLNDKPVCSMMIIPSTEKSAMKLGVSNYNYENIIDYGPMMVGIKYVGNKLQYQMLKELELYCILKGYKYAVSTIHPENIYSINNLIKDEFTLIGEKEFSRGMRKIYLKNLIKK